MHVNVQAQWRRSRQGPSLERCGGTAARRCLRQPTGDLSNAPRSGSGSGALRPAARLHPRRSSLLHSRSGQSSGCPRRTWPARGQPACSEQKQAERRVGGGGGGRCRAGSCTTESANAARPLRVRCGVNLSCCRRMARRLSRPAGEVRAGAARRVFARRSRPSRLAEAQEQPLAQRWRLAILSP